MGITKMSVTGKRGLGNITLSYKNGRLDKIRATGKMADLIANRMATDLGIEKVGDDTDSHDVTGKD